jgi:hypothetical protein
MKKVNNAQVVLSILITILSLFAVGAGMVWPRGEGQTYEVVSLHGDTALIQGSGLYRYDTVTLASQVIAQDHVTLFIGVPLLILATILARRGSLRGRLLLAGTLAYFLYTYTSYAFGLAYNALFLVYVALFALVLFAFVLALMALDIPTLPESFSPRLPRRLIALFLFTLGAFLLTAWLERIVSAALANQSPYGLETNTTLVIQVLDLGLIVPVSLLGGILLWRRRPWGYLLSSIILIDGLTYFLALLAMIIGETLAGVQMSTGETAVVLLLVFFGLGMTVTLLRNISTPEKAPVKA